MNISPGYLPKLSAWLKHNLIAASLVILFASAAPRLFLTWRSDPSDVMLTLGDSVTYIRPAQSLIRQRAFLQDGKPEITRTPGYPVFLAGIMLLISDKDLATQKFNAFTLKNFTDRIDDSLRPVLIVQALILSLEVVVLYWLARRILPPVTAFIAGLLAALSPWGAVQAGLPMTEGLFLLLLALIFFTMKLTAEAENLIAVAVGGICTGLFTAVAVLVRPVWPLVLLISGTLFVLYGPKRKGVWLLLSTTLVFAATPVLLWKARNLEVGQFNGLSDIAGKCTWRYLVPRVNAQINNQDRQGLMDKARAEESNWKMSVQQADHERWRRAKAVFVEHPVLTSYYFLRSSAEHAIHPSPDVLSSARLNFYGDYWVFALLWAGLLVLAWLGWRYNADPDREIGTTNRNWLSAILLICVLLTLSSGLCFGGGSRYRVSLELIVPLLAAAGLSHIVFHHSLRRLPQQA